MLKRSIDPVDIGPTLEERIFLAGKRLCYVIAAAALGLGALDLMNIRSMESAAMFVQDARIDVGDLPTRLRSEIGKITLASYSPEEITLAIPRAPQPVIAKVQRPAPVVTTTLAARSADPASPVAELAALRHEDAVELAMVSPPATPALLKLEPALQVQPARAPIAPSVPVTLASIDPVGLPVAEPGPVPVVLSMIPAIPLDKVPMPREAPGAPPPSPAQRLKLEGKEYARAERCLANAIYFEARSEPIVGQKAVAQVVLNRVFSGFYPNDVCSVVYQNAHRRLACQFTFACDGKSKAINERGSWARATRIARETLSGHIYVPAVAKSTHYHAVYVHPNWVREMRKMVRYGIHNFYRPIAWGTGEELPVWGSPALWAENKVGNKKK